MNDFNDQVVVVTGAAGNLGAAVTRAFYQAGAKLVAVNQNSDRLEEALPELIGSDNVLFAAVDLTDAGAVEGMVYEVVKHFGRIDVLANIAGGFRTASFHETALETWDLMFNLNAKTIFLTGRAAIPHMLKEGKGKIVNVAARAGLKGETKSGVYSAAKSAVIRLTESMAAEYKDSGLNVNCILPGTIDTPQNRRAMPDANFATWVQPEAIADVILFLASDAARAIQGAAVPVYGRS